MNYKAIGKRLRQTRDELGITERQAADAFGVTLPTYRKYEAGGRQHSSVPVVRFADKYNVSLDWIFTGTQPMILRQSGGAYGISIPGRS